MTKQGDTVYYTEFGASGEVIIPEHRSPLREWNLGYEECAETFALIFLIDGRWMIHRYLERDVPSMHPYVYEHYPHYSEKAEIVTFEEAKKIILETCLYYRGETKSKHTSDLWKQEFGEHLKRTEKYLEEYFPGSTLDLDKTENI